MPTSGVTRPTAGEWLWTLVLIALLVAIFVFFT